LNFIAFIYPANPLSQNKILLILAPLSKYGESIFLHMVTFYGLETIENLDSYSQRQYVLRF